jgi:hypothetical protein
MEYGDALPDRDELDALVDRCIATCTTCGQQWTAVTDFMGTMYVTHVKENVFPLP